MEEIIWSKFAKRLLLKNLTEASIAISCQKRRALLLLFLDFFQLNNLPLSVDAIYLEHVLKRSSVNSFLTFKVDKCGKNKLDAMSRKLSEAQANV